MPTMTFEDFKPGDVQTYGEKRVEIDEIVAFAKDYDPQPMHLDDEAARSTIAGGLIASGWHTCSMLMRMLADHILAQASSLGAPGIEEVNWRRPVRPGDKLRVRQTVLETRESRSRPEMGMVRCSFALLNQNDEAVLEQTNWIMFGKRGASVTPLPAPPVAATNRLPQSPPAPPAKTDFLEDLVIGETTELGEYHFGKDDIIAFARDYDPQPFHLDEEAARRSLFGGLCASGWHTAGAWMRLMIKSRNRRAAVLAEAGLPVAELGPSPGFKNLRWLRPVYAGEIIAYRSTLTQWRPSASRPGWGLAFHRNEGIDTASGQGVFSFDGCVLWQRRPGAT